MTSAEMADHFIHNHMLYAVAAGAIPIPLLDLAAVTAVQVDLVRALARVYEGPFDQATGKALVVSLVGASTARVSASAVKAIPGVGIVPGVIAQAGFAAASTFAVGQLFRAHFEAQRGISELEPDTSKVLRRSRSEWQGDFSRFACARPIVRGEGRGPRTSYPSSCE